MTTPLTVNGHSTTQISARRPGAVLVVGDLMLDHTVQGRAARLSPEAPVPVLAVEEERYNLGGAANVARNLVALGARALLAGVVGRDRYGARTCVLLNDAGIDASAVLVTERPTTVKTRFVASTQQLLRVDREEVAPLPAAEEAELIERLGHIRADAVIVSDYAKGVATDGLLRAVFRRAREWAAPIVVDPKAQDFARFAGCTAITPNAAEAAAATGLPVQDDATSEAAGRVLLAQTGAQAALITRGPQGLTLVTADCVQHLPTHAVEVFDVAGAGDTLVAAFTAQLTRGASLEEAARVANVAASLAVRARGVTAVTADQLRCALTNVNPVNDAVRAG